VPDVDKILKNAGEHLKDSYNLGEMEISLGEIKQLGVFHETDTAISYMQIANYGFQIDGKQDSSVMAFSSTIVLTNNVPVYVYAYKSYESEKDIEWVKNVTLQYLDLFSKVNK